MKNLLGQLPKTTTIKLNSSNVELETVLTMEKHVRVRMRGRTSKSSSEDSECSGWDKSAWTDPLNKTHIS